MVMKDRYILIERSDTLVNSYCTLFTFAASTKDFTFYCFEACISNASVSSENNFGII